jgi:DNA polymerase-3 subunit epsilon
MREIILDTETTGFEPSEGHRIIEIGAIELINRLPTGKTYHQYINPEREVPEAASKVHGLTLKDLVDKPLFKDVVQDFLDFVGGSALVIHNASFDMKFLNAELVTVGRAPLTENLIIDTLQLARRKHPGSPASLDALCQRYGIDNAHRELHGALLDCELLAEVYIDLLGLREPGLSFDVSQKTRKVPQTGQSNAALSVLPRARPAPLVNRLSAEEAEAHKAFVQTLGEGAVWHKLHN